jgi:hypothetical protein
MMRVKKGQKEETLYATSACVKTPQRITPEPGAHRKGYRRTLLACSDFYAAAAAAAFEESCGGRSGLWTPRPAAECASKEQSPCQRRPINTSRARR